MKKLHACLLALPLAACAPLKEAVFGRETPLAPLSWAALGATPREEILRKFGPPEEIDGRRLDGRDAEVLFYLDTEAGEAPGYRLLACEFLGGALNAYAYEDSAGGDFDERAAAQLQKGRSTRRDAESRLGPPAGKARLPTTVAAPALALRLGGAPAPLAALPEGAAEAWQYRAQAFDGRRRRTSQKTLTLFFDAAGTYLGAALLQELAGQY